jgi:glutathione synthase/RimK-type ligase-like ATP-grasp enzyme
MIGLVTYQKYPNLTDDDRPLIPALEALGQRAVPVIWDDPGVRWQDFETLVVRSCWDYHLRAGEFVQWLETIESLDVPLWNPVPVVRWNMHKRYLRELASHGVLVPRTEWLARAEPRGLSTILEHNGMQDAIVKPAISASATDTWRTTSSPANDNTRFRELVERSDVLVQELIPEVAADGEWSVMFIGGAFSHSTIKRPRSGDFRVQTEMGGSADPARAPDDVIEAASRITGHIPGPWLFARIDGVVTEKGFMLMEVECIEPLLFFSHGKGSVERFAKALVAVGV